MTNVALEIPDHVFAILVDAVQLLAELGKLGVDKRGRPLSRDAWFKQQNGDNRVLLQDISMRFDAAMAEDLYLKLHQEVRATVVAELIRQTCNKYL